MTTAPLTATDVEHISEVDLPLEELYVRFAPYVAAVATRILGRQAEVQDVVHDVFAAAVTGLRQRNNVHQVRGWLAKVAVRSASRQLRARRVRSFFERDDGSGEYEALVDPGASPEDRHTIQELYRTLDQLPARQRVAWVLRHVEGERLEEVAELCGCSLATAKRRIAAAQEKVLRRIGDVT